MEDLLTFLWQVMEVVMVVVASVALPQG